MDTRVELVREELRLRREIATHELQCLMEDDADADEIDEQLEEIDLIDARRDDLAQRVAKLGDLAAGA